MTLPIPTEMTAVVGQILTAAQWNSNVRDGIRYLANPPIFVGTQTVGQAVATGTNVNVTLDAESVDTYNGHSTTTNSDRYTAQVAGWYLVVGAISFPLNATGRRAHQFETNGTVVQTMEVAVNANSTTIVINAELVFLNVNDWVGMVAFQTSGATLTLNVGTAVKSFMACLWVHA